MYIACLIMQRLALLNKGLCKWYKCLGTEKMWMIKRVKSSHPKIIVYLSRISTQDANNHLRWSKSQPCCGGMLQPGNSFCWNVSGKKCGKKFLPNQCKQSVCCRKIKMIQVSSEKVTAFLWPSRYSTCNHTTVQGNVCSYRIERNTEPSISCWSHNKWFMSHPSIPRQLQLTWGRAWL